MFVFILDINECNDPAVCKHHECVDKPIGYECKCKPGFKNNATDYHICEDINECLIDRPCSQTCINTAGSYHCYCVEGYQLQPDRRSCKSTSGK